MIQYNLNQGQKGAAEAFFQFLLDPDSKEFIISGPAGVGKTYWMGYIIDVIMPRYEEICKLIGMPIDYDNVFMTATTNKAAEVLGDATQRVTQTIHSFLNLKVYEDYATGVVKLSKNLNTWKVHENKIIFIDECSMIDKELYNIIHEGTHKCKLVYVGDHNQLAPVREEISPIYRQNSQFFSLDQQMRNAGQPALMDICAQLRKTVETKVFEPIKEVPGVIDYLDDTEMQNQLRHVFNKQNKESRILAYTNKRVIEYNDYIRNMRALPSNFTMSEILVNNTPIRVDRRSIPAECEVTIIGDFGLDKKEIAPDVYLDIQILSIQSGLGDIFTKIPIPTDRAHFNALISYYKKQKNWERYFYLKTSFPDLRPRDAATVHKSQGSTYDSVFIDLGDISTCRQADQTARLLYVAFSRAKTRVFVYGDLADKYGGFIRAN